jgi:predicted amidophosphoribosyltransferase
LKINKPKINIVKIKTPVSVPQKTLKKLDDRIENARETFVVDDNRSFKKILLVDDALGSGATFNEICKKIKDSKVAKKTICLAITGSFSGFEVISEV